MTETKKSGLATASLVLGIVGVCTSFIPIVNNASFIMGVLSIIFGIISFIKKASKGKVISGIVLGIMAICITLSMQQAVSDTLDAISDDLDKATGGHTEQVLKDELDVSIGDFKANDDYDTKLSVKVKNKTKEKKSFSIKIEAVNKDGERIEEDTIYANDLKAGQSQKLEAFTLVTSDKTKDLKNAKFKVIEASSY